MYRFDNRTVLTLDAGGTNFVFGAMRGNEYVADPITYPSNSQDLDACLSTMVKGFEEVMGKLESKPVAISFAFPGPADYPNGIIGGYLPNFPSFRSGVALGPYLEKKFGMPVYINNDGDLFAYGEAMAGALPEINRRLEQLGSPKRYRNMLGYTFGTGFGIGMVIDGKLNRGNNSCVETFCLRHKYDPEMIVEAGVSVKAVKRLYAEYSGTTDESLEPKDICDIAAGKRAGDAEAAKKAFRTFGEVAGDAMATAVTLTDSIVVIGGGLTGAAEYYKPGLLGQMRGTLRTIAGETVDRIPLKVFDLDNPDEFAQFAAGAARPLKIYGSEETVIYDPQKSTGIIKSTLGASKAISIGAYSFALSQLDAQNCE
ncbi:MAG: ROK family protein [Clostridium sp.]|nr:ROK family protein [Clostridium sp.]